MWVLSGGREFPLIGAGSGKPDHRRGHCRGPSRLGWCPTGRPPLAAAPTIRPSDAGSRRTCFRCLASRAVSVNQVIVPGEPRKFRTFDVGDGLDALRGLIAEVQGTGDGIALEGRVGITSHFGDLLRRAKIPSVIRPQESPTAA